MEDYMFGDWLDSFFYDSANTVQSTIQVSDPKHNMALSFHKYGGVMPENYQNVFGPGAAPPDAGPDGSYYWWDAAPNLWMIAHMKKLASLANMPLWMGEFGTTRTTGSTKTTGSTGRKPFVKIKQTASVPPLPSWKAISTCQRDGHFGPIKKWEGPSAGLTEGRQWNRRNFFASDRYFYY